MGNSPSHSRSNSMVKSARTSPSRKNDQLLQPSTNSTHRRSRSANAASPARRQRYPDSVPSQPPPPYSRGPPTVVVTDEPGSLHSSVSSIVSTSTNSSKDSSPIKENRTSRRYLRTPMRRQTEDEALATLKRYNTVLVVDDSSSMRGSLWNEAKDALCALAERAGQFDTDGIDIYFLNDYRVGENMKDRHAVEDLFDSVVPRGVTPLGEKLELLLRQYLAQLEQAQQAQTLSSVKPVNYIVITDGAPTDDPESVIVQAAKRLDKGNFPLSQVGIQFVQIGRSTSARRYLDDLDNALESQYNIRDIVDTTPYLGQKLDADALVKILLGGINRRVDRTGAKVFHDDLPALRPSYR